MNKITLNQALERLEQSDSFILTTHAHPDGDAIGTTLSLLHLLEAIGKSQIACVCEDPVPRAYTWLPGAERFMLADDMPSEAGLAVIVDTSQFDRIGAVAGKLGPKQPVLVLDHHLDDRPDGTWHYIDPAYSSAAEIIVDLFECAGISMSKDAAACAYTGLTTDTGGFRYANTTVSSHLRAAKLVETGIDVFDISSRCFDVMSVAQFELLRRVLDRMAITMDGHLAYSFLDERDMTETEASAEDTHGLVNYARNIEGVEVGILFRQTGDGKVKVSMRSRDSVNSAAILKSVGGGGHKGAAGATLSMALEEARDTVVRLAGLALRAHHAGTAAP